MRSLLFSAALCAPLLLTVGCASDAKLAANAARNFTVASQSGDPDAVRPLLTAAARTQWSSWTSGTRKPTNDPFTIGDAAIDGDQARVPVTIEGTKPERTTLLLRREEQQWRVWGMRFPIGETDEAQFTVDFEHPEATLKEALGAASHAFLEGMSQATKGISASAPDAQKAGRELGRAVGGFFQGFAHGLQETAPSPGPTPPAK
jgi:hypothetical protein